MATPPNRLAGAPLLSHLPHLCGFWGKEISLVSLTYGAVTSTCSFYFGGFIFGFLVFWVFVSLLNKHHWRCFGKSVCIYARFCEQLGCWRSRSTSFNRYVERNRVAAFSHPMFFYVHKSTGQHAPRLWCVSHREVKRECWDFVQERKMNVYVSTSCELRFSASTDTIKRTIVLARWWKGALSKVLKSQPLCAVRLMVTQLMHLSCTPPRPVVCCSWLHF